MSSCLMGSLAGKQCPITFQIYPRILLADEALSYNSIGMATEQKIIRLVTENFRNTTVTSVLRYSIAWRRLWNTIEFWF